MSDMTVTAPTATTLKTYGFGCGPYALADNPVDDWLALLKSQDWVCGVCERQPTPSPEGKVRFVTDHEHVKGWAKMPPEERRGYVRGLTCWTCNHYHLGRGINVPKAEGLVRFLKAYYARRPA